MSEWLQVCALEDVPRLGARVVTTAKGEIAVFRNARNEIFALKDKCPHKGGPLSQGMVSDRQVTCPLHGWNVHLDSGEAVAPDKGCTHRHQVKVEENIVYLHL